MKHYPPEPGRWWIRCVPRAWPGAPGLWTHLADRTLGTSRISSSLPNIAPSSCSDVVYLPPVGREHASERRALAARLTSGGVPVLGQWPAGEGGGAGHEILDPVALLLERGVDALEDLETECRTAVWPLIAGLTDDPVQWRAGVDALAAAGVATVVPCALELTAAQRRRLAELGGSDAYRALFHGPQPSERDFARVAAGGGLGVLAARPTVPVDTKLGFNRLVATELIRSAELWLRLERAESAGQDMLRAARWAERSQHDLRALMREGNLEILPWLDARSRSVVIDLAQGGASRLGAELLAAYLGEGV